MTPLMEKKTQNENRNECQLCKKKRHIAKECKDNFCQLCDKPGHHASTCRSTLSTFVCQICKKTGHTKKNCLFAQMNFAKSKPFRLSCKKIGHTTHKRFQNKKCKITTYNTENCKRKQCNFCTTLAHDTLNCSVKKAYDKIISENTQSLSDREASTLHMNVHQHL